MRIRPAIGNSIAAGSRRSNPESPPSRNLSHPFPSQESKKATRPAGFDLQRSQRLSTRSSSTKPRPPTSIFSGKRSTSGGRCPAGDWRVTPETARLLQHWRHYRFSDVRPFFCQVEAVETAIWLAEVAPSIGKEGKFFLGYRRRRQRSGKSRTFARGGKLATGGRPAKPSWRC